MNASIADILCKSVCSKQNYVYRLLSNDFDVLLIPVVHLLVEAADDDRHAVVRVLRQPFCDGVHYHRDGFFDRIAVDAGGDSRECDAVDAVGFRQFQTAAVAGSQELRILVAASVPWAYGVDDIFRPQVVTLCDF